MTRPESGCCYSPCANEHRPEEACGDALVTCDECGWSACRDDAEANGWDEDDGNGGSWCDECKPDSD